MSCAYQADELNTYRFACCAAVFMPTMVFEFGDIRPFQRGFFCDDDSIKYPYKANTVPWWAVGVVGILVPVITVSCFTVCITSLMY